MGMRKGKAPASMSQALVLMGPNMQAADARRRLSLSSLTEVALSAFWVCRSTLQKHARPMMALSWNCRCRHPPILCPSPLAGLATRKADVTDSNHRDRLSRTTLAGTLSYMPEM